MKVEEEVRSVNKQAGRRRKQLWQVCKKFIDENDIGCSETIYQCDRVQLSALEFIEAVCEVVGYKKFEEDDDES